MCGEFDVAVPSTVKYMTSLVPGAQFEVVKNSAQLTSIDNPAENNRIIKKFLDKKVDQFNQPFFIKSDPICIPHSFTKKQDIEIAGFFAAIFAWGNRTTIINKSRELMQMMDNSPHHFCLNQDALVL